MNGNELFDIIGETPERYVLEAASASARKRPASRMLLIAAVIALVGLLVGCAVAYVFGLQDLKVGEWNFHVPPAYDDEGNLIPVETHAPITRLSLQGANMEALSEWLEFTNNYDRDGEIASQADKAMKAGKPWDIPENYYLSYGCYSQEMVDKLDEIIKKYDLNLLSTAVHCEYYEGNVILGAMGLDGLLVSNEAAKATYGGGYFYPEGTFDIDMEVSLDTEALDCENAYVSYRYSVKEYFDPVYGSIRDPENCTQWNYTRKDGRMVLLVFSEDTARIYADLQDAFLTIHVDRSNVTTERELEQFAEIFDLSVKPCSADIEKVEELKKDALTAHEAERAAQLAAHESQYQAGYQEFVDYRLETSMNPEYLSYIIHDVNGDGIEELIIDGLEILSMKDGSSYKYFDIAAVPVTGAEVHVCEGNVVELCHELFAVHQYYFYQAGEDGAEFITGVIHDTNEDVWYRSLDGGSYNQNRERITAEEAQYIRDAYTRVEMNWIPLKKYGQEVSIVNYEDPYSEYIADKLERFGDAGSYEYVLLDVNGDGIEELITRDVEASSNGKQFRLLSIHTIRNGELWDMDMGAFAYICEGGILEDTLDFVSDGKDRVYHQFYRCTVNGVEPIEKISRDPITLYWSCGQNFLDRQYITEEEANAILSSYKRLELDWKIFAEYPLS